MNFRRSLPEIRWQSCLSLVPRPAAFLRLPGSILDKTQDSKMNFKARILVLAVATACLLVCPFVGTSQSPRPAGKVVDPALFKEPPAQYRGHEMYGYGQFNLSNLSEDRIREAARRIATLKF